MASQPHAAHLLWLCSLLALLSAPLGSALEMPSLAGLYDSEGPAGGRLLDIVLNASHTHDNDRVGLDSARLAWRLMERQALEQARRRLASLGPLLGELAAESGASPQCRRGLEAWLEAMGRLELWATSMWNSWGSLPAAGFLEGSFTDFGSYRSCLGHLEGVPSAAGGQLQYCSLDFQPIVPSRPRFHSIYKQVLAYDQRSGQLTAGDFAPTGTNSSLSSHQFASSRFLALLAGQPGQPAAQQAAREAPNATNPSSTFKRLAQRAQYFYYVQMRLGSCWPAACSTADVQALAQAAGARLVLQAKQVFCTSRAQSTQMRLDGYQLFASLVLAALASFALLASLVELLNDLLASLHFKRATKRWPWVECYLDVCCLQRNCSRLFSVSPSLSMTSTTATMTDGKQAAAPVANQLSCLHGLKFISMLWVIFGHTLLFIDYQSFTHAYQIIDQGLSNFFMLPTLIPNFSVDTFFVISGLLSSYIIFSLNFNFNPLLYTVARYARLTPQLVIIILMFFLLPLIGDGPIYRQNTQIYADRCKRNFWINLLYLQSFLSHDDICILSSWWLSIDMSFHLISLAVIYFMFKRPRLGMLLNFVVIGVATFIGTCIHYKNGFAIQYLPSIPQKYEINSEQTHWFFHKPYPHAAAYFIGNALGYVLAKGKVTSLTKQQLRLGWLVSAAGFLICSWMTYCWNLGAPYTQLEATFYYQLCQTLWPISIAWIILACSLGYGGIIDSILSAKIFVPFGRITYMTYLSHIIVIYYYAASIHVAFEPSFLNLTYICVATCVISLFFGALLSLIYEAPLLNLQKILLKRKYIPVDSNPPPATAAGPTGCRIEANGLRNIVGDLIKNNNHSMDTLKNGLSTQQQQQQ